MTEFVPGDWLNVSPRYVVETALLWAVGAVVFSVATVWLASVGAWEPATFTTVGGALGWFGAGVNVVRYALVRDRP